MIKYMNSEDKKILLKDIEMNIRGFNRLISEAKSRLNDLDYDADTLRNITIPLYEKKLSGYERMKKTIKETQVYWNG